MTRSDVSRLLADAAATFDGSRLTLARHLAGLRKSDLAGLIEKSATAVASWENGTKAPSPAAVGQLAVSLGVDPGFFGARADDVAHLSGPPHFRSLRSTTQRARDQAAAYGHLAVGAASSLERHVEFPDVDVPQLPVTGNHPDASDPEEAARMVRQAWQLEPGPIRHVVRTAENHGILVVFSRPEAASVDAYSFCSRLRPAIVLNPMKNDYYRQRFDVAHEIGHLVMHGDAEPGGRAVENEAHRFAAEFLTPADQIIDLLPTGMHRGAWQQLAKAKEQWGVSMQALLYRARRLGRLSEVSYRNAMTTVSTRGWRRDEPGLVKILEQPSLLARAVELLAASGVDEAALMAELDVPPELFRTVTARGPRLELPATLVDDTSDPPHNVVSLLR